MICESSYCSNTTIFTFVGECHNPLLTVHFRLTDFFNADTQYLTITVNQQRLGFCTGPNNATYYQTYGDDLSIIPEYTDCLNDFSIAELTGYDPDEIILQLRISPHVSNKDRAYKGNLLFATVAFGCSGKYLLKIVFLRLTNYISNNPYKHGQHIC